MNEKFDEAMKLYNENCFDEAAAILKTLAENGHAEAQCELGQFYQYGFGVERDEDKAIEWFSKAADQGHTLAQKWHSLCLNEKEERESKDPKEIILAYSYDFENNADCLKAEKIIFEKLGLNSKIEPTTAELARKHYTLKIYTGREEADNHDLFTKIDDICRNLGGQ